MPGKLTQEENMKKKLSHIRQRRTQPHLISSPTAVLSRWMPPILFSIAIEL